MEEQPEGFGFLHLDDVLNAQNQLNTSPCVFEYYC
jgi:hypothetical protein